MGDGFSFPPPPPPPPKAAPDWNSGQYEPQTRGGRGRGRGRGGNDSRGRGRGNYRGINNQHSGSHLGMGQSRESQNQPNGPIPTRDLPPGAHINPNFTGQPHPQQSHSDSPGRTYAGHKRKLDALRGPQQDQQRTGPPAAPVVPSFGAPVPATPGLPKPLPQSKPRQPSKPNALGLTPAGMEAQYSSSEEDEDGDDDGGDGEEKDVDEEAMYAELGAKLTFEHNGVPMSLNSPADIAAWQAERRRKWPTTARMAEKDVEKRRIGDERRRMLAAASALDRPFSTQLRNKHQAAQATAAKPDEKKDSKSQKPESELQKARRQFAEQTATLDDLRSKVADGEARASKLQAEREAELARAKESSDAVEGQSSDVNLAVASENPGNDEQVHANAAESDSEVLSESSVVSSDSDSNDDGPPEQTTSKQSTLPPASAQRLCRYFVASGRCRDGDACRFRHELPDRGSGAAAQQQQAQRKPPPPPKIPSVPGPEKKGIFARLMEQEQADDDALVLKVIKHLGKAGYFN